jgi:hypothetical protein
VVALGGDAAHVVVVEPDGELSGLVRGDHLAEGVVLETIR